MTLPNSGNNLKVGKVLDPWHGFCKTCHLQNSWSHHILTTGWSISEKTSSLTLLPSACGVQGTPCPCLSMVFITGQLRSAKMQILKHFSNSPNHEFKDDGFKSTLTKYQGFICCGVRRRPINTDVYEKNLVLVPQKACCLLGDSHKQPNRIERESNSKTRDVSYWEKVGQQLSAESVSTYKQ